MTSYSHTDNVAGFAAAFYNAGILIEKKSYTVSNNVTYVRFHYSFTAITNLAFSCELALKSILPIFKGGSLQIRGHELEELFNKLDQSSKDEIIASAVYELNVSKENPNITIPASQKEQTEFYNHLHNVNNIFQDARYIYEGNKATTHFHISFLKALAKSILIFVGYDIDPISGLLKLLDEDITSEPLIGRIEQNNI